MSVIRVTATTMGVSTPASAAEDTGDRPYRWRGHKDWTPNHPAYRDDARADGPAACKADKAARLAEFAGYLEQGLTAQQAGKLTGIAPKTARTYERELKQQGDGRDG